MNNCGNKAKTAILAGIGRLGENIATELLQNDWKVCISFREGRSSEEAVNRLIQKFGREKVFTFSASLEDFAQARDFISACLDKQGKPDMLINIASEFPKEKDDWQRWQKAKPVRNDDWRFYDSNFMVARNPITALLEKADCNELCIINFGDARCMPYCTNPQCLDPYKDYGGILNFKTADICGFALNNISETAPPRHRNPYTLAKIDIARLTQKLALECAPKIRINTIAAGPIIPSPDSNAKQAQSAIEQTALKRWGGSEAITKTVGFLFDNKFITGQILYVDGAMALCIAQNTQT